MDRLTPERRSWNMSRIRGKDTKPEREVRSLLHKLGYRFRLNSQLPGKPDIVLPRYRTAIFVHGCFWHRHKGCSQCYTPKSRLDFWTKKFASTVKRDAKVAQLTKEAGWRPLVIWECDLKDMDGLATKLRKIMKYID